MSEWAHDTDREVDQVIGAYFLTRRALFQKLGGFDQRFFVYFEEVDFCVRARTAGSTAFFLAGAQAFHRGGGSSEQVPAQRLFYSLRSRMAYSHKHFTKTGSSTVAFATTNRSTSSFGSFCWAFASADRSSFSRSLATILRE